MYEIHRIAYDQRGEMRLLGKATLKVFLCLTIFLLVLVGCGSTNNGANETNKPTTSDGNVRAANKTEKEYVIGFAIFNVSANSYLTQYDRWFKENAPSMGVKTIVLDAAGDPLKQNQQMDSLIQQKVDAIILWPVNSETVLPKLKSAKEAGIPVIITNTPIENPGLPYIRAYSGPNNVLQGKLAAEMMIEGLHGKGKIVEITGLPGYKTSTERSEGFAEEIAKHPDMEIIDVQPGNWDAAKAQQLMEDMLTKHPKINGVYAHADDMAVGAINALKEAGRLNDVVVTSPTLFAVGYDAIKRGEQYGSVFQSPEADAKLALETAIKVVKGEDVPAENFIETPKITRANIASIERPGF